MASARDPRRLQGTACRGRLQEFPALPSMLLAAGAFDRSLEAGSDALRAEARSRGWKPVPTAEEPRPADLDQHLVECAQRSRKRGREPAALSPEPRRRARRVEGAVRQAALPPAAPGDPGDAAGGLPQGFIAVPGPLARFGFARRAGAAPG